MANKVLKALGLGCLGALIIACLGFSYVIYQDTLIHWWRPVVLSLTIAIGSGKFLWKSWRRLTDTEAIWVNYGVHTATVAALLIGIFFIGNYFLGDRSCITYQDVTITRVYREKHYHTKRISRRVYGRGSSYWVYKADVELPGRDSKDIRITEKRYDILAKGDTLGLAVRRGFFGATVIDTENIKYPTKSRKSREKSHGKRDYNRHNRIKGYND